MAIDPYSPCPGGTGKKVKFCCPDLLNELEKIQKMVAADQRHACLDYIAQLEAKFPNRSCLLTTKALLQGQLGDADAARQTVDKVLEAQPENPVALAEHALLAIDKQGLTRPSSRCSERLPPASSRWITRFLKSSACWPNRCSLKGIWRRRWRTRDCRCGSIRRTKWRCE